MSYLPGNPYPEIKSYLGLLIQIFKQYSNATNPMRLDMSITKRITQEESESAWDQMSFIAFVINRHFILEMIVALNLPLRTDVCEILFNNKIKGPKFENQ